MNKFIYVVKFGKLNNITNEFELMNNYFGSREKAEKYKLQILENKESKNFRKPFEGFFKSLNILEYEKGEETVRIIIDRILIK